LQLASIQRLAAGRPPIAGRLLVEAGVALARSRLRLCARVARCHPSGLPTLPRRRIGAPAPLPPLALNVQNAHLPRAPTRPQVKLNTDESPSVATEYGIRSIPTVMIFKNGQARCAGVRLRACVRWWLAAAARRLRAQRDTHPTLNVAALCVPNAVQKLDTVIGAVPKSTLVTTIDKYIN
jgi:hypothetical protein